jgi:hypothetical protein
MSSNARIKEKWKRNEWKEMERSWRRKKRQSFCRCEE